MIAGTMILTSEYFGIKREDGFWFIMGLTGYYNDYNKQYGGNFRDSLLVKNDNQLDIIITAVKLKHSSCINESPEDIRRILTALREV